MEFGRGVWFYLYNRPSHYRGIPVEVIYSAGFCLRVEKVTREKGPLDFFNFFMSNNPPCVHALSGSRRSKLFRALLLKRIASASPPSGIHNILKDQIFDSRLNASIVLPLSSQSLLQALVTGGLCPDGEANERAFDIHNNPGYVVALVGGKLFPNNIHNGGKPALVNHRFAGALKDQAPLAPCHVLRVFPFRLNSVLEEIVSLPSGKLGGRHQIAEGAAKDDKKTSRVEANC